MGYRGHCTLDQSTTAHPGQHPPTDLGVAAITMEKNWEMLFLTPCFYRLDLYRLTLSSRLWPRLYTQSAVTPNRTAPPF
jgi:hypothetical protein